MTREKMMTLAREHQVFEYCTGGLLFSYVEQLEAFYHKAQAEAFEAAAEVAEDVREQSRHHLFRSSAEICAAAIREMAKESGK